MESFWQLGDELRGLQKVPEDQEWSAMTSKLAELTKTKGARTNNLHLTRASSETTSKEKSAFIAFNNFDDLSLSSMNLDCKTNDIMGKNVYRNNMYGMNTMYKNDTNTIIAKNMKLHNTNKFVGGNNNMEVRIYNNNNGEENKFNVGNNNGNGNVDKRFKTLPLAEMLPRNETLGGYIFVCNNDTMQEDLKRMLFGLPPRYRDSVRAITPGLPLFLYNYTTHQLHGIFEAASFGGTNIDPTAWEDKKCKGESRFPAQVRIRVRTICRALEEDSFRPVLHHYDGPKFRLELSIPETLQLLDLCKQASE